MSETKPSSEQPDPCARPLADDAEQQVEEIADRFLDQLQAGAAPERSVVVAAHPELAGLLEKRLAFVENLHRAARLHRAGDSYHATSDTPLPPGPSAETLSVPGPPSTSEVGTASSELPKRIGRYVIRELLGQGASGTVYRAYDPKFDREVALKVFRSACPAGSDFAQRFQREARIAAQLRHPHIVPVHDAGEHEGRPYIDMRLVRGETLEVRLKRGPLPLKEAAELVRKLADALDYAHGFSIIHRDVKPANVLLDERGQPQLTDFGLARRAGGGLSITEDGQILGTPAYMSPEQAGGGAHRADGRTDVYGLGAVLYRLLTGRVPFPAAGSETATDGLVATVYRVVHTNPPHPRTLNPAVPRDLETICLKALAKDREDRFATAADLAEELRRWLQDEPLRIRRPTWWERTRRWARRNRLAARIMVVAGLVLLAVSGTLGCMIWVQHQQFVDAELLRTQQHLLETQESEDRAVKVAAFALLEQARQRVRLPTMGRRKDTLELLRRVAQERRKIQDQEVRERLDLEARSVLAEALGVFDLDVEEARLPRNTFLDWPVALHPSGRMMAIGTHLGPQLWVRGKQFRHDADLDGQKKRPRLSYSSDGKYLVFAPADGGLEVWDEGVAHPLKKQGPSEFGRVLALGFDRTGATLWACCDNGRVQSFTLPSLQPLPAPKLQIQPGSFTAAAFNADASRLAVGDKKGHVLLYETSGKELRSLPEGRMEVEALTWSPDSTVVAVGTQDGAVQLWPIKEGPPSNPFILGGIGVGSIQFTPNGRWLLAGLRSPGMKMWDVATGEQVMTGPGSPMGFSQDGRCFATGGVNAVEFCDLLIPRAVRHFSGHRTRVHKLSWSRDSRHLVSLDSRFEVRVWSMHRDVSFYAFPAPPGDFYADNAALALSDDGCQLAYASGGTKARALIYELPGWNKLSEWELGGGFDRLACTGGRKFVLVREKKDANWHVQSVVLELEAGKEPVGPRPIRCNLPGEKSFLASGLTLDGRYYWGVGPRLPEDCRRVEVLEVATGKVVEKRDLPKLPPTNEHGAFLSPDGHYLWTGDTATNERWLYDLSDIARPARCVSYDVFAMSPDRRWLVYSALQPNRSLILKRWEKDRPWLLLDDNLYTHSSFSTNGRYLALGKPSGYVTVLDLPALEHEIAEFERTLQK